MDKWSNIHKLPYHQIRRFTLKQLLRPDDVSFPILNCFINIFNCVLFIPSLLPNFPKTKSTPHDWVFRFAREIFIWANCLTLESCMCAREIWMQICDSTTEVNIISTILAACYFMCPSPLKTKSKEILRKRVPFVEKIWWTFSCEYTTFNRCDFLTVLADSGKYN